MFKLLPWPSSRVPWAHFLSPKSLPHCSPFGNMGHSFPPEVGIFSLLFQLLLTNSVLPSHSPPATQSQSQRHVFQGVAAIVPTARYQFLYQWLITAQQSTPKLSGFKWPQYIVSPEWGLTEESLCWSFLGYTQLASWVGHLGLSHQKAFHLGSFTAW